MILSKLDEENLASAVCLRKMVLAQHNCALLLWLVKWAAVLYTCRNECKLSVSDWSIIMIGPGGLLLVVPQLFVVPVSVLWVGLQKST